MSYGIHTSNVGQSAAGFASQFGSNLRLLRRRHDLSAWEGTVGSWDVTTGYGAPGGPDAIVAGNVTPYTTLVHNLVPGGPDAVRDAVYGGVTYAAPAGQSQGGISITADASLKLAPLAKFVGLSFIGWFQATGGSTVGGNSRLIKLGPVFLVPDPANLQLYGPGMALAGLPGDLRIALSTAQAKPRQIALYLRDRGAGNYRAELYLDRNPLFVSADFAAGTPAATEAAIGARDGAGTVPGAWQAMRVDDFTVAGKTFEDVLSADYRLRGRAFGRYDY